MKTAAIFLMTIGACLAQISDLSGSFTFPLEGEAIRYHDPAKNDPIARGQWGRTYGDPKQYGYD